MLLVRGGGEGEGEQLCGRAAMWESSYVGEQLCGRAAMWEGSYVGGQLCGTKTDERY